MPREVAKAKQYKRQQSQYFAYRSLDKAEPPSFLKGVELNNELLDILDTYFEINF
jgi:hypothetical protein